jgi:alcohol dehydrogenase (cytochrome c)
LAATVLAGLPSRAHQTRSSPFVPVTDAALQKPDPADWLMWRRTLDSWGYSPLDQINRNTVRSLALAWSRPLGPGIQEGTPLVYRGVMYFPNPSDVIQAIDAKTGDLLWEYRRSLPEDLGKSSRCPRSIATWRSMVVTSSIRAQTTTCSPSTPNPENWPGRRRSSTT